MANPPASGADAAPATAEPTGSEIKVFLIADVRGYTRFTQAHGDEAAARLASRFANVTRNEVERAGGKVIELRGDEALAIFGSPRQAISAAVDLQSRFIEESIRDPKLPLTVGIGLDAGEAIPVEDGYRGASLNIAARLCSLAAPGEVLASQEVAHLARRVVGTRFLDHGPTTLKGIAHPVNVVKVVAEAANPYKGLRPFDENDASDFFGREALIDKILKRLSEADLGSRFLAVVGPSGSGKSSVVRAGVIPAVRNGALGTRCQVAVMVPGQVPFKELMVAVERVTGSTLDANADPGAVFQAIDRALPGDGSELLVVLDQFEELFTLVEDERVRQRFLDGLCTAVLSPTSRVRVIATLRADFYDRPLLYKKFGDLVGMRTQTVTALSAHDLERAISAPSERVGVVLQKGLVAQIVADVSDQPGALPLLQYALTELFDYRRGTTMTLDAYAEIGGVSGALVRRAEALYGELDVDGQDAVRQLFLRLAASEDDVGVTRRRVSQADVLSIGDPEVMQAAFEIFGTARLLSFDRDPASGRSTVEVAHEALLVEWPRLRGWLEAAAEDLRAQRRLAAGAREWAAEGRDPSFLVTGSRLMQLAAWRENSDVAITKEEREFLDASLAEHERREAEEVARERRERDLERRSLRRLRALVAVMAIAALVAGGITFFAFNQQRRAERAARIASARELSEAAVANLQTDPELSILLAKEAIAQTQEDGTVLREAEEALHRAVGASRIVLTVPGLGGSIDWSPKGVFVTEGPEDKGLIDIRNVETGERELSISDAHNIDINDVQFSPDGSMLATSGDDGALKIWDPESGDEIANHIEEEGQVWGPSFSADGSRLAASWSSEQTLRVLDPSSGRVIQTIEKVGCHPFETSLSPNGKRLAVTDNCVNEIRVFDVDTGRELYQLEGHVYPANTVVWSPDGRRIASSGNDGTVFVWDGRTGRPTIELLGHTESALDVDWGPDGRRLLSTGIDGEAKVWEVHEHGGRELMSLAGAETGAGVTGAFSPDGRFVITGDLTINGVKIWDVSVNGDAEWINFPTDELAPVDVALLPNDDVIAPVRRGSAAIWNMETGKAVRTLGTGTGSQEPIIQIAVSPDGSRVATVRNFSHSVNVWDPATGEELVRIDMRDEINNVHWAADNEHLLTMGGEQLAVFDREGRQVESFRLGEEFLAARFLGDDLVVAATAQFEPLASKLHVWNWRTGESVREMTLDDGAFSMAVDPEDEKVALGHDNGTISLLDAQDFKRIGVMGGRSGPVSDIAFSADGRSLVAGGSDSTVRVFDVENRSEELVLRGHRYLVSGVAFTADGERVLSASPDGMVKVWALELQDLLRIANDNVKRDLTDDECRQYLHQERC